MSQREDGPNDQDPAPLKHSDAERNSGEQAQPESGPKDEPAGENDEDKD